MSARPYGIHVDKPKNTQPSMFSPMQQLAMQQPMYQQPMFNPMQQPMQTPMQQPMQYPMQQTLEHGMTPGMMLAAYGQYHDPYVVDFKPNVSVDMDGNIQHLNPFVANTPLNQPLNQPMQETTKPQRSLEEIADEYWTALKKDPKAANHVRHKALAESAKKNARRMK